MTKNNSKTRLKIEDKLKLLEVLLVCRDKEADRFWNRFNVLLVVNSGLLAAVSLSKASLEVEICGKNYLVGYLAFGVAGLLVSLIWFFLLRVAKSYETRWHKDIDFLLNGEPELKMVVKGYSDLTSRIESPTPLKASQWAMIIPWIFVLVWLWAVCQGKWATI